ncbi:hypothetical protein TNCV_1928171 [Trichonephila clavipes]|nr:hypothetical protein TNCV_1928171 [Trichonephila clavipes]
MEPEKYAIENMGEQIRRGGSTKDKYTTMDKWTHDRFVELVNNHDEELAAMGSRLPANFRIWNLKLQRRGSRSSNRSKKNNEICVGERNRDNMEETHAAAEKFRLHTQPSYRQGFCPQHRPNSTNRRTTEPSQSKEKVVLVVKDMKGHAFVYRTICYDPIRKTTSNGFHLSARGKWKFDKNQSTSRNMSRPQKRHMIHNHFCLDEAGITNGPLVLVFPYTVEFEARYWSGKITGHSSFDRIKCDQRPLEPQRWYRPTLGTFHAKLSDRWEVINSLKGNQSFGEDRRIVINISV